MNLAEVKLQEDGQRITGSWRLIQKGKVEKCGNEYIQHKGAMFGERLNGEWHCVKAEILLKTEKHGAIPKDSMVTATDAVKKTDEAGNTVILCEAGGWTWTPCMPSGALQAEWEEMDATSRIRCWLTSARLDKVSAVDLWEDKPELEALKKLAETFVFKGNVE